MLVPPAPGPQPHRAEGRRALRPAVRGRRPVEGHLRLRLRDRRGRGELPLADAGFVNDVVLTTARRLLHGLAGAAALPGADRQRRLARRARGGSRSRASFEYATGFNAERHRGARGGRTLIVVKTNTGKLFTVNAAHGRSREIAPRRARSRTATGCCCAADAATWSRTATTRSRSSSSGTRLKRGDVIGDLTTRSSTCRRRSRRSSSSSTRSTRASTAGRLRRRHRPAAATPRALDPLRR